MKEEIERELKFSPWEKEEEFEDSDDFDIYTEEGIENYADDDGISALEEGFMKGYLGA